jgi:hypothetical protein
MPSRSPSRGHDEHQVSDSVLPVEKDRKRGKILRGFFSISWLNRLPGKVTITFEPQKSSGTTYTIASHLSASNNETTCDKGSQKTCGSYEWTIPDDVTPGSYSVQLHSLHNRKVYSESRITTRSHDVRKNSTLFLFSPSTPPQATRTLSPSRQRLPNQQVTMDTPPWIPTYISRFISCSRNKHYTLTLPHSNSAKTFLYSSTPSLPSIILPST